VYPAFLHVTPDEPEYIDLVAVPDGPGHRKHSFRKGIRKDLFVVQPHRLKYYLFYADALEYFPGEFFTGHLLAQISMVH